MLEDNFCFPGRSTFPVTGSLNSSHLALAPAVAPPPGFENFYLNATVSTSLTTLQGEIMSSPPGCGFPSVLIATGQQVASFAGSWMGTLTSVTGPSATISATITEAGADSSGFPVLSGNVTFSNSSCFTSGALAGNQIGPTLLGRISTTNGTLEIPQIGNSDTFLVSSNQLSVSYSVQGGTCNGDYAKGTLTRQ
jgi:hypothetical protein